MAGNRTELLDLTSKRSPVGVIMENIPARTSILKALKEKAIREANPYLAEALSKLPKDNVGNAVANAVNRVAEGMEAAGDKIRNASGVVGDKLKEKAGDVKAIIDNNPGASKYVLGVIGLILLGVLIFIIYGFVRRNKKKRSTATMPVKDNYKDEKSYDGRYYQIIPTKDLTQLQGTNHTVGFWLYVRDWEYRNGQRKIIMTRGFTNGDFSNKVVCPEIFLSANINDLNIAYETTYGRETITVPNIPTHKWVCIVIVAELNSLSIYLDGRLRQTSVYNGVIRVNNGDLHINYGGGFDGRVAIIKIWDKPYRIEDVDKFYQSTRKNKILEPMEKVRAVIQ